MKNNIFLRILYILLPIFFIGCNSDKVDLNSEYKLPIKGYDLSYTPYDSKFDNPNYIICDSTGINSGRNRLMYVGGTNKLRNDINSNFLYKQDYESFSGYIVIRFIVNCKGESGRYRAQSLNLNFSPTNAPSDLLSNSLALIKNLDNWTKSTGTNSQEEYSKYINLKINNGKIQHVLL